MNELMTENIFNSTAHNEDREFNTLKAELHQKLIGGLNLSVIRTVEPERLRAELRRGAEELCNSHASLLSLTDRERLVDDMLHETLGLGPLEPLMADPTISDILINGVSAVYVERRGKLERTDVRFRDENHLLSVVQRIAGRVGRRVDESSPMVDARLSDGSRLNAVIKPLAIDGALVSIRRFGARPLLVGDLLAKRTAVPEMIAFLAACVKAKLNIMISGGTGSGKSTLLNILSSYIAPEERIVTIEDVAELKLQQPHVALMETRPANLEGRGEVTCRDLLKNALRMRPDRIIVGECRGKEASDMLQALNTGHNGGMTTIHAKDARDATSRLAVLVGMSSPELPMHFIHRQISSGLQIIVQVSRLAGGARKITQISEVLGMQGENITMHDLFVYEQTGINHLQEAEGRFLVTGIQPHCLRTLRSAGIELPTAMFERGPRDSDRMASLGMESN